MASEIRKTFDFFSATSSEGPVDELVLSGGCALTPNLQQILRERFEVPTELMNPLRRGGWEGGGVDRASRGSRPPRRAGAAGGALPHVPACKGVPGWFV